MHQVFGRLTVLRYYKRSEYGKKFVQVKCVCGSKKVVLFDSLMRGRTKSCGCLRREISRQRATKHGYRYTPEYVIWCHILARCLNPKIERYKNYGGRGISIQKEWTGDGGFERFLSHIGKRPSSDHQIDRIDNDVGYIPGNVRWSTRRIQSRNKTTTRRLTWQGKTRSLIDWSELLKVNYWTLHARLNRGWSVSEALSTKVQNVVNKQRREKSRK